MKLVPIEFLALLCTALCCLHPLGWASPSSTSVRDGCIWWLKIFTIVCLRMTRKLSIGLRVTNQFYYVSEFGNTEYNEDWLFSMEAQGFPCGSAGKESACKKESTCNVGRPGFDPWVGKIPWRREQLPTPILWPGEFHGLYSPWGRKEWNITERLSISLSITFTCIKEIASGELFFGTGNSARCSVVTQRGAMGCGRGV